MCKNAGRCLTAIQLALASPWTPRRPTRDGNRDQSAHGSRRRACGHVPSGSRQARSGIREAPGDGASGTSIGTTKETYDGEPASSPAVEPGDDAVEYISGAKLVAVIASITLVAFLMLLDTSIVATAIPSITNEFHSLPDVGWYGSAYQLASAALQPLTGKIYSKFNIKWTFLAFFALFELGSLVCGVASSSKVLVGSTNSSRIPDPRSCAKGSSADMGPQIVGRAIAGMGGAGLMNGAMTIIANCVPLHRQPTLMGDPDGLRSARGCMRPPHRRRSDAVLNMAMVFLYQPADWRRRLRVHDLCQHTRPCRESTGHERPTDGAPRSRSHRIRSPRPRGYSAVASTPMGRQRLPLELRYRHRSLLRCGRNLHSLAPMEFLSWRRGAYPAIDGQKAGGLVELAHGHVDLRLPAAVELLSSHLFPSRQGCLPVN